MLDVGWTELLLIGVVALIVIGPKDLPVMFHSLGRIMARARGMAREFTSAMEDAAKASGLDEATKDLRDIKNLTSPRSMGVDALGRAAEKFEKWDPMQPVRNGGKAQPDPAAPRPPAGTTPAANAAAPASPAPASTSAPAETAAAPSPAPAAPAPVHDTPEPGTRRLHAVRRSDRS
ncbi:MAG TPA: Sec-independent protein translocase protein TatB [Paracoccus solventivorans]|uniref:Sec-independent protein translocase protein TatB n=1 Tax=Paracoccus solventivorans TaxID=53463 RepID=UPI002CD8303D|nr:Sec-independent protein translocase protein TatB [Paracoccus solventivorans]HMM09244.1 Sec-independent protein translocase protein TatB [Paracoccus solventivorans]